jgi:hypothetical protein
MQKQWIAVCAAVMVALAASAAMAQLGGKGKGKAANAPSVRYFDLSSGMFADKGAEAILKETRQGTTTTAAEIDVCFPAELSPPRMDRFVIPLKVDGNKLTGSGQTLERKQAVSVSLTRRLAGSEFNFQGALTVANQTEKVDASGLSELSETEMTEQYLTEDPIEAAPENFIAVSSQSLVVRVSRDGLIGLLNALRDQRVRVVMNGLVTTCHVLRTGRHTVQIDLDAERAGAVLTKIKSIPDVSAAGYLPGQQDMSRAVRFPSEGWREAGGKLERDKLATAVATAVGKAMGAAVVSSSWETLLGELTVVAKRADERVLGLKLVQTITVKFTVGPELPTSNQHTILWIDSVAGQTIEDRPDPKLEFFIVAPDANSEEQSNEPDGSDGLTEAVAAALKGTLWDSDNEQWQQ